MKKTMTLKVVPNNLCFISSNWNFRFMNILHMIIIRGKGEGGNEFYYS